MEELCEIANDIPLSRPKYMTIGIWRHYQAPYAFSYRGRLLAEYIASMIRMPKGWNARSSMDDSDEHWRRKVQFPAFMPDNWFFFYEYGTAD